MGYFVESTLPRGALGSCEKRPDSKASTSSAFDGFLCSSIRHEIRLVSPPQVNLKSSLSSIVAGCRGSIGHTFEIPLNHGKEEGVLHVLDITADVPRSMLAALSTGLKRSHSKNSSETGIFQYRYKTGP